MSPEASSRGFVLLGKPTILFHFLCFSGTTIATKAKTTSMKRRTETSRPVPSARSRGASRRWQGEMKCMQNVRNVRECISVSRYSTSMLRLSSSAARSSVEVCARFELCSLSVPLSEPDSSWSQASGTAAVSSFFSSDGFCLRSRELRHDRVSEWNASSLSAASFFDGASFVVLLAGAGSRGAKLPRGRLVGTEWAEGGAALAVLERHGVP